MSADGISKALQEMVAKEVLRRSAALSSENERGIAWIDDEDVKQIMDEIPKALQQVSDSYASYFKGRENSEDEWEKLECYKAAAESGNPVAMMSLASLYQYGVDTENLSSAAHWYEQAASCGMVDAMMELGHIYSSAEKKQVEEAFRWYHEAYLQGEKDALGAIIRLYYQNGAYDKAHEWIALALSGDAENEDAQYFLGMMYLKGCGVPQDYENALLALRKAAKGNSASAMNALGCIYRDGLGVSESKEKAKEWFLKADQEGYPGAKHAYINLQDWNPKERILEELRAVIVEMIGVEPEDVTLASDFEKDLGGDSLDEVEIVMATEEAFRVELPDDEELEKMKTVNDLYQCLLQKLEDGVLDISVLEDSKVGIDKNIDIIRCDANQNAYAF